MIQQRLTLDQIVLEKAGSLWIHVINHVLNITEMHL